MASNEYMNIFLGKVFTNVERVKYDGNDAIVFTVNDYEKYMLGHEQQCCEDVSLNDLVGDLSDLINTPILLAEEREGKCYNDYFGNWTFYTFRTIKGTVDLRFMGEDRTWYSEAVDLFEYVLIEGLESPDIENSDNYTWRCLS